MYGSKRRDRLAAVALAVFILLGLSRQPLAEMTPKTLQVATRSLAFLTNRDISGLRIAIIYSPEIAASKKEAESLAALLGSSFSVGRVTLSPVPPVLLSIGNLASLDNKDVAFVTDDLRQWYSAIAEAARPRHVITITTDSECVIAGYCIMAVQAEPRVQVLINRASALQTSVEFTTGFRLLVTEF